MKNIMNPLSNVSKNEILSEELNCPSCLSERVAEDAECTYCGVVFSQYYRWSKTTRSKLTISGLYHLSAQELEALENSWTKLQTLYWSEEEHFRFMMQCLRLKSLPFAIHCYQKRLELFEDDDIAHLQIEKLKTLGLEWHGVDAEEMVPPINASLLKMTQTLGVIGIISGVVILFLGLLTTTPIFYVLFGIATSVVSIGVFAIFRKGSVLNTL